MKFNSITEEEKSVLGKALFQYIKRETDRDKINLALAMMLEVEGEE